MTAVSDIDVFKQVRMALPRFDMRFWTRALGGSVGAIVCATGAGIALVTFAGVTTEVAIVKFLLGVLLYIAGFIIARSGSRPPAAELHFDPKYGEFILVPQDEGWEGAHCVLSTDAAELDVSGRHLSLVSENNGLQIRVALRDALTAQKVSASCQASRRAA